MAQGNTLVMKEGSKLTNYSYTPKSYPQYYHTAVTLKGGAFELRGGELSNILGHGNLALIYDASGSGGAYTEGRFIYDGGVFSGNTGNKIAVGTYHNPSLYEVTDGRFAP